MINFTRFTYSALSIVIVLFSSACTPVFYRTSTTKCHTSVRRMEDSGTAVYFKYNESSLEDASAGNSTQSPSGRAAIDSLFKDVKGSTDYSRESIAHDTIEITGFADQTGNRAYNKKLALKRAESVRDYMIAIGVDASRIVVLGKLEPLEQPNCTKNLSHAKKVQCLWIDRRAEIRFIRYVR